MAKYVLKKAGSIEDFSPEKIKKRLKVLEGRSRFSPNNISYDLISQKATEQLPDDIKSVEIDTFIMEQASVMTTTHPDYSYLASAIAISSLHKKVGKKFAPKYNKLKSMGILNEQYISFVEDNIDDIEATIDYSRDYEFDYFGYQTLERAYLLKDENKGIIESPQDMMMRVAIAVSKFDRSLYKGIYSNLLKYYTHATPTLFNAGLKLQQLSSCFLMQIQEDSIEGIYDTLKESALISKSAGGIGISITNVRANGSYIKGTNGTSNGIIPMLKVFNETARYVDQGGGKRKGSIAVYIEPWHADIYEFLDLRKNTGKEELRARDLFLGLWIPDLFMKKVKEQGSWYLMCPNECKGLDEAYGEEFEKLYNGYVEKKMYRKEIKATELWYRILSSQMETGTPYMLYKDSANKKSNQKNLGTLKNSNLCVSGSTKVWVKVGSLESEAFETEIENIIDINKDIYVLSYNIDSKIQEYRKVLAKAMTNPNANVNTLDFGFTTLEVTPDHKIYTLEGYKMAKDLSFSDKFINIYDVFCYLELYTHNTGSMPVYDITVEGNENFFANGILVHNCAEILEYVSPEETAVCNLASLALPSFIANDKFDFNKLYRIAKEVTVNLNNVIDINYYPSSKAKHSNLRHRPIGIGIQGLADTFAILKYPFSSEKAKQLNKEIFATIYYGFLEASHELAMKDGAYESFEGSPISQGIFQFDMWGVEPIRQVEGLVLDWDSLRAKVMKGVRNSLGIAPMPTASCQVVETEVITGNGAMSYMDILSDNGYSFTEIEANDGAFWLPLSKPVDVLIKDNYYVTCDKIFYNGHKEVFKIEMEDSTSFEATANHRFLVQKQDEQIWAMVDELNEGDLIVNTQNEQGFLSIVRIYSNGIKPTWDLHVPEHEHYITRNGCVSHNTSQIMGYNECFEPFTSNIYSRRVLSGDFVVANKYLIDQLQELGLWDSKMKNRLIRDNGSVQELNIPQDLKEVYKTVWEIKQRDIIDMAADRGAYICQTQSMNLFLDNPTTGKMTSMHFHAWEKGLKTGMYYLRSKPAADAIKFTVEKEEEEQGMAGIACSLDNPEGCQMCGS